MVDQFRTEADLLANLFQDGQADNSISAQDMRDFIKSSRYFLPLGWEFIFDLDATSGSPVTLAVGVPQQLTINSNPAEELRYPSDFPGIWNDITNKLTPPLLNGAGVLRLSLEGEFTGGVVPHIDLKLDVGSDPIAPVGTGTASNVIYHASESFSKQPGVNQAFNFIMPLFVGSDFATNGGVFIVEAVGAPIDIYNITLSAFRIFAPNPAGEG